MMMLFECTASLPVLNDNETSVAVAVGFGKRSGAEAGEFALQVH